MHTSTGNITSYEKEPEDLLAVSAFPRKLYNIVNNPSNNSIISWYKGGEEFIIHNTNEFAEKILAGDEFSSANYASFVRQLNMYDFHKLKNRVKDKKSDIFYHKYFIKDRPSLLKQIKRKSATQIDNNEETNGQIQVSNKNFLPYLPDKTKVKDESEQEHSKKKKISKNVLSNLYSNFLKSLHVGRRKQDEIEHKIDSIYRQNLELITQNKTLLNEINNKTEYTKTLEQLFVFILEFFMKKNDNDHNTNITRNTDFINAEIVKKLFMNNKDQTFTNLVSSNNLNKTPHPMLSDEHAKLRPSIPSSPNLFHNLNNLPSPGLDQMHNYSTFDLFDNNEKIVFSRRDSISSNPKLIHDDYMNVTKSPQTSNNDFSQFAKEEPKEQDSNEFFVNKIK